MSDLEALVAAVRDAPNDDTPRLVLADWYDDHGTADEAALAALIRGQVEAARTTPHTACVRWPQRQTRLGGMLGPPPCDPRDAPATLFAHNAGGTGVVWHRGTLEGASAGVTDWLTVGHDCLRRHPLLWVHLHPPLELPRGDADRLFCLRPDGRCEAHRFGWRVEIDGNEVRRLEPAYRVERWFERPRWEWRLFFEAVFPGITFLVAPGSPARQYPAVERPSRIAVPAVVTPPGATPVRVASAARDSDGPHAVSGATVLLCFRGRWAEVWESTGWQPGHDGVVMGQFRALGQDEPLPTAWEDAEPGGAAATLDYAEGSGWMVVTELSVVHAFSDFLGPAVGACRCPPAVRVHVGRGRTPPRTPREFAELARREATAGRRENADRANRAAAIVAAAASPFW